MLGGSWAALGTFPPRKFGKKYTLVRFDVSLHTILAPPPPRPVSSHTICGPTQVRFLAS